MVVKKTLEPSALIPSKRTPSVKPGAAGSGDHAGGEVDRVDRVADVHVEVLVDVAVGVFETFWPRRMREPSAEMSSSEIPLASPFWGVAVAGSLQAGKRDREVFGAGRCWRRRGFRRFSGCGHRSRRRRFVVAAWGKARGRAEDQVFAVGGEVLGDVAVGLGGGAGFEPARRPCPGRVRRLGGGPGCRCSRLQSRASSLRGRRRRRCQGSRRRRRGRGEGLARRRGRWRGRRRIRSSSLRCRGWRCRGRGRGWSGGRCRGCRRRGRRRGPRPSASG